MADPFTWIAIAGTVISVVGGAKQAQAAKQAGVNANIAEQYKAAQMDQAAGQEIAASQRVRDNERHRAELVASRALALTGKGGGGFTDPTITNLLADLEGEGTYRGMVALYQGEDRARQLRQGGDTARLQGSIYETGGNQRAAAIRTGAVGSALLGASSLYSKYNAGTTTTTGSDKPLVGSFDDPRFA